ncbi:MAG: hypothetical protein WCO85_08725 [Actinomycetes bacterium]
MSKVRFVSMLAVVLTAFSSISIANAAPSVLVQGGPYTNLDPNGADIHFGFGNFPTAHGLYLYEAVQPTAGARPTIFSTAQVWVSNDPQAPASPKGDVKVKVTAYFTGADCYHMVCGIFVRLDHTAQSDTSEDQFIPITFAPATAAPTTAPLPVDTITASISGKTLSSSAPFTIAYQTPVNIDVVTGSGATPTFKVYGDNCTMTGSMLTALKGSGQCDVAVTSPGNAMSSTVTSHFPVNLKVGIQTPVPTGAGAAIKNSILLAQMTNFGEKISYKSYSTKVCTVNANQVKILKSGTCTLVAKATGRSGLFSTYSSKITLKVSKIK